ncbi:MAG: hypothetical protein KDB27_28930 [Planctomycetales bacterium]|nr:hypothetical protein [Planctomycetales bacterium]
MPKLIPSTFVFRMAVECQYCDAKWSHRGFDLDERFIIPSFRTELEDGPHFADFRVGWNESGLFFWLRTTGKKQSPWCRESRVEDSDGLSLWIDTRDTQTVHRATRFCHRFIILPQGAGRLMDEPIAAPATIARAKELPKPVQPGAIPVRSEKRVDGYILQSFIPADAMTGFEPDEHPRIGFYYAITDRELGWQTFSLGPEFPFASDPSLWGTLELAR